MIAVLRQRNYALLWTGGFISQAGDWLLQIGLPIAVYFLTGSALVTSIVFIVELVPALLFGSLAGVLVDRWDRRQALIIVNALQAVALLPLLAVHSSHELWIVYSVSVIEALLGIVTGPAESALLPRLVAEGQVLQANSLGSLSMGMARLIGSPLGGFIVGLWGLRGVVLLDAASFVIAASLIASMHVSPAITRVAPLPHAAVQPNLWRELVAGMRVVGANGRLMLLFVISGIQSFAQGIFLILYIVFVLNVLHGTATDVGLLRGVQAIGSLLGGMLIGTLGHRFPLVRLIGICSCLFGVIDLVIWNAPAVYPSLALTIALFILVGIPGVGLGTGMQTFVQIVVPDAFRGRVFGLFQTVGSVLLAAGLAVAGTLGDHLGVIPILNAQGALYIMAGIIALLFLGGTPVIPKPRKLAESGAGS